LTNHFNVDTLTMSNQAHFKQGPKMPTQITCQKCKNIALVFHLDWEAVICQSCKEMIENPINTAINQLQSGFSVYDEYGAEHIALSKTIQENLMALLRHLKEG
jgi:ribosomal protein S27E